MIRMIESIIEIGACQGGGSSLMHAQVSHHFDLSERVAIVTGATKGLGRSMAQGLAGAGASIAVVSRDQVVCSRVAD
jgi:hypothetical protein